MDNTHGYSSDVAFTPIVKVVQTRKGSRRAYGRMEERGSWKTRITYDLAEFIVPSTVPYSLTGMRIAMGISFMTVVASEMLGADSGLGYLILSSRLWMATDKIFVGILVLGLLGLLADRIFETLINRYARLWEANS